MKVHPYTLSGTVIIEIFCLWFFSVDTFAGVVMMCLFGIFVYGWWYLALEYEKRGWTR